MNAKTRLDASPNVIFLQDLLDEWLGRERARVILPITDPYVVHHGALGSFATVYLPGDMVEDVALRLRSLIGIEVVLNRAEAAARFQLPADRIGDLVVVSERSVVWGPAGQTRPVAARVAVALARGGISEQRVPIILNRPIAGLDSNRRWRNFDVFDLALNHAQ